MSAKQNYLTQAFIGGELLDSKSGKTFITWNPATGQKIADITECEKIDVETAIVSARKAFDSGVWSRQSPTSRKKVLLRFAGLIEKNADYIAHLDSLDAGKPITDCQQIDIPDVINTITWYAESIDKLFDQIAPTGPENLGLIIREPIGVVAAILPWNFPALMMAWKIAPALAAGNSVIVKPAEQSPLSAIYIAQLASEAGLPDGVFNVVPGLGEIAGKALGLSNDVDLAAFTGSTSVGKEFLRYSADSNMKRIILECGGKSPQIVMPDAIKDIASVTNELINAAFWNTGQNCTAGSRILVHESIREEVVASLVTAASEILVGDPSLPATRLGPVIEPEAMERILRYIKEGSADGATVETGGEQVLKESGGWFVPPTILNNVQPSMSVAREEIFGPVVSILGFSSEAEAIKIANDSEYGLAASVFTHDLDSAHRMARAVRAGTVSVNCYSEGSIATPFGGYKSSGFGGRDKGVEAFNQYTELKTVWFALNPNS
jgi:gamma-glutamyl-gamma-aminobutyraldehyde dehydrogenase